MAMTWTMQLVIVALLAGFSSGQQGYGLPYPPQFFYLAPSDAAVVLAQHAATVAPVPIRKMVAPVEDEDETTQFHSQDGKGQAVFGYLAPDQTRIEERARDGSVKGSYSYLDPDGRAVKVQYWDTGSGFHSAGNHLPSVLLGLPQPVQDTPEVKLAKEQHLKFFQQTLLHLQQQQEAAGNKEETAIPDGRREEYKVPQTSYDANGDEARRQQFLLEQQQHQQEQLKQLETLGPLVDNALLQSPSHSSGVASDSVVVESDNSNIPDGEDKELIRYPNLDKFPQNLFDPTQIHDATRDAVIVESSDSVNVNNNNLRIGKSSNFESKESKPLSDSAHTEHENKKVGEKDDLKPSESKLEEKGLQSDGEKKIDPVKNRGFFYSFQHPIPIYVQVQTVAENEDTGKSESLFPESLSHSQKAAYFGAIPIAAVHDFQVPPWQKEAFKNVNPPLYAAPIVFPQRNAAEPNKPLTYSQKASYFGAIPVAAVHDQQVHPLQKGSVPDHQTAPLYIETSVEDN